MEANTKEHIKNRMIKNAAQMWNVQANDIETSFDPIITLLLSACASEIEKIGGEVNSSTTRITKQVVQLMTPENINGPSLAHGILCAEPIDDLVRVKPEFLFNYRKSKVHNTTSLKYKDIYFSPVQGFNLINARVQFMATAKTFLEISKEGKSQDKISILESSKLDTSTLYLGLTSDLETIPLEKVSLYFDMNRAGGDELFYHHLLNAEWSSENGAIDVTSGFHSQTTAKFSLLEDIFENVSNKTKVACQQVINRYEKNYITLLCNKGIKKSVFDELNDTLADNDIKIDETIRWIKIDFPEVLSSSTLKNVKCHLNAFPVVNRKLEDFSYSTKQFINLLPIQTENLFFDIKSITNTDGKAYVARGKDSAKIEKGTFIVRGNSIGKLDKRKAREYILHLIELLKDESAAFSFLNNDFLRGNLKVLNQAIALLEKKISEAAGDLTHTNYISIKPYKITEQLLVEYWTTNGSEGNNIKSGSKIPVYKGIGIKQGASYLLTTTHGGKDDPKFQDRLHSSRKTLLSRDRVVTREDIKALCIELYGNKINKVEIKRGYKKDIDLKKGLLPCMEIVLTPNRAVKTDHIVWETLGSNLLYHLKKKSMNVLPYKITITK